MYGTREGTWQPGTPGTRTLQVHVILSRLCVGPRIILGVKGAVKSLRQR